MPLTATRKHSLTGMLCGLTRGRVCTRSTLRSARATDTTCALDGNNSTVVNGTDQASAFMAHAYDQPEVVAGVGIAAREIVSQANDVDSVVVAVGGGGLIAGIASWVRDEQTAVAAEPERCRSYNAAIAAGGPTEVEVGGVAASSLAAASIGEHTRHARRWIDRSVLVSDDPIVDTQKWLWVNIRLAVEPPAATTVASLMSGSYLPGPGEHVVAMLSGVNVDPSTVV